MYFYVLYEMMEATSCNGSYVNRKFFKYHIRLCVYLSNEHGYLWGYFCDWPFANHQYFDHASSLDQKKNTFHFIWTSLRFYIFKQDVALGFPSLVSQVSGGIVMIVFNMIILGLAGNTGVAAYGVVANISLVIIAIYTGIGQGIQPLVSTFYGKGEKYMA